MFSEEYAVFSFADVKSPMIQALKRYGIESSLELFMAYSEPWKTYHNMSHVLGMWQSLCNLPGYVAASEERYLIGLMIFYHDAWYKVKRESAENESKSAAWATRDLKSAGAPHALILSVEQGIMATVSHTLEGVDPAFKRPISVLLDLDLAGLGQSPEKFKQDTENVWHEFQPVYTREEFNAGRTRWAASFLERERIYHNPEFEHLEHQARKNLKRLATD